MLSRKRQERKMMMKTAKTLGIAGSVPECGLRIAVRIWNSISILRESCRCEV